MLRACSRSLPLACCLLPVAFSLGCSGSQAKTPGLEAQRPEEVLENALTILKDEKPSTNTYRTAVQQLNNYLDLHAAATAKLTVSDAERKLFQTPALFDSREERIKEVERKSFSVLDIDHIDTCFLFRDAAKWLQSLPLAGAEKSEERDLELANQAFAWTMRQVQLEPRVRERDDWRAQEFIQLLRLMQYSQSDLNELVRRGYLDRVEPWRDHSWPADEVVRRGSGDAEERLRAFLGLALQCGLDGCVVPRTITVTESDGTQADRERPWAAGVRIGKEIYLFDPLLGKPVPGAGGKGIATLRELRKDADAILKPFYANVIRDSARQKKLAACLTDPNDPVAVAGAQLAKPSVLLWVDLPALSPRMRELQAWLKEKGNNPVVLHDDLPARLNRFQSAGLDVDVRLWTGYPYPSSLATRFVEDPLTVLRKQAVLAPRFGLIPPWARQFMEELGNLDRSQRMLMALNKDIGLVRSEPGSAHDLLVRGRPDLAIDKILFREGQFDKIVELLPAQGDIRRTLFDPLPTSQGRLGPCWKDQLIAAETELQKAYGQRKRLKEEESAARAQLDETVHIQMLVINGLWVGREVQFSYLNHEWIMPEVREHLAYYMALAKMELAIRAELQAARPGKGPKAADELTPLQQWQSAAEWFERYLTLILPRPRNHWAPSAVTHLATCREAIARLEPKKSP